MHCELYPLPPEVLQVKVTAVHHGEERLSSRGRASVPDAISSLRRIPPGSVAQSVGSGRPRRRQMGPEDIVSSLLSS